MKRASVGWLHSAQCRFSHSSTAFHVRSFILLWMATTASMCASSSPAALPLRRSALKNICGDGYTQRVEPSACGMLDSTRSTESTRVCPSAGSWFAAGIILAGLSADGSAPPPLARTGQPPCSAPDGAADVLGAGARTGQPPATAGAGSAGLIAVLSAWPMRACRQKEPEQSVDSRTTMVASATTLLLLAHAARPTSALVCRRGALMPARVGAFLPARVPSCRRPLVLMADDDEPPQWTAKQLIREEIESPFRKPRQTLAAFSIFSAGIALLVSGSRAATCALGGACLQPVDELLPNIGVNLGVIAFAAVTLWNDARQQNAKLRRIARGGELASLQLAAVPASDGASPEAGVQQQVRMNAAVKDFRKESRVVIVAGGPAVYQRAIASASEHAAELRAGEIVVVPVLLAAGGVAAPKLVDPSGCTGGVAAAGAPWGDSFGVCYTPRGPEAWGRWLAAEVETAVSQGKDVQADGITIAIKKSGKIGKRTATVPSWPSLIDNLLVTDANFGMPKF